LWKILDITAKIINGTKKLYNITVSMYDDQITHNGEHNAPIYTEMKTKWCSTAFPVSFNHALQFAHDSTQRLLLQPHWNWEKASLSIPTTFFLLPKRFQSELKLTNSACNSSSISSSCTIFRLGCSNYTSSGGQPIWCCLEFVAALTLRPQFRSHPTNIEWYKTAKEKH
jgi:hypothetical protein